LKIYNVIIYYNNSSNLMTQITLLVILSIACIGVNTYTAGLNENNEPMPNFDDDERWVRTGAQTWLDRNSYVNNCDRYGKTQPKRFCPPGRELYEEYCVLACHSPLTRYNQCGCTASNGTVIQDCSKYGDHKSYGHPLGPTCANDEDDFQDWCYSSKCPSPSKRIGSCMCGVIVHQDPTAN
jgi:hypothetical protein